MVFTLSLLLIFFLVRYVLPVVLRAVLGSFVRQQVHKAQQGGFGGFPPGFDPRGFGGQQPPRPAGPPPGTPGQIHIDYVPPTVQQARQDEFRGGEYVDFEEVK